MPPMVSALRRHRLVSLFDWWCSGLSQPRATPRPRRFLPRYSFNPHIEAIGDDRVEGWEGCLSVPGMRGVVSRYERIKYTGIDAQGKFNFP